MQLQENFRFWVFIYMIIFNYNVVAFLPLVLVMISVVYISSGMRVSGFFPFCFELLRT